jgi:hypothetical protein
MISGYRSPLYDDLLSKWRRVDFETTDRRANVRTESIWMNYPQPVKLADYRYLGANFRERERIKRQQKRWKENLLEMPEIERNAMIEVLRSVEKPGWYEKKREESQ